MLLSVHMLFAGDRQILVQNIGEKQGVLLSLYLAANESDQTSCGHVLMQQVRHVMHGLPSEVPIMYSKCNVSHNFIPASASGSQLFSTQDDLSEMQFPEHCKLYVWPGESLICYWPLGAICCIASPLLWCQHPNCQVYQVACLRCSALGIASCMSGLLSHICCHLPSDARLIRMAFLL